MTIFKDTETQEAFDRNGFVTLPFLNPAQVKQLAELYNKVDPNPQIGFSSSIYNHDIQLKKKTSEQIASIFQCRVDEVFQGYRPLGSSFLCKTPGEKSFMPVHQDWTVVDESKYSSVTVWVPLVDVDERNGAMRVLPGSHRFSDVLRSPTLPGAFTGLEDDIYARMQWVKIKAGSAVIFNHALLHASPPNLSSEIRPIATFGLVPEQAELCFHHRTETGSVEKYSVDDDFFITYNQIGQVPENGQKLLEFDYRWTTWDKQQLDRAVISFKKQNPKKMKPLFNDPEKQEFFNRNGFVKFKMLDESDVKQLYDYFFEQNLHDHSGYGFNMSMEDDDKEKVARIRKKIYEIALPKALPHLADAKVIAGSFVVKEKNPQGVVPPHQDWSFVENEGENYSVTCWIPLVPTKLENGYLGVIKGSHLIYDNIRPSPSPQVPTPLMDHLFTIFPYLEMYEMQPGEALIFDHRTFHASTPNITDDPRIAIGLGFTQSDSEICHYNLKQNGKKDTLLKYKVDDAFLLKYDNSKLSRMYDAGESIEDYEVAEELPYVYPILTSEDLLQQIKDAGNVFNVELAEHMAKLFNYNMDGSKKEEEVKEPEPVMADADPSPADTRSFWQIYTPMNVVREIKYRITGN